MQNTSRMCTLFLQHYQLVTDINGPPFDSFLLKAKTCSTPPEAAPVCTTARLTHHPPPPRQTRLGKEKSEPPSRSANSAQLRLQMRNRHRESGSSLICFSVCLDTSVCGAGGRADGGAGGPQQLLGDGQKAEGSAGGLTL